MPVPRYTTTSLFFMKTSRVFFCFTTQAVLLWPFDCILISVLSIVSLVGLKISCHTMLINKQHSGHWSPEPWNGRSIEILPWSKQHIKVKQRQQVYSAIWPVFCQQGVPGIVWYGSLGRAGPPSSKRFVLLFSADCLLSNRPLAPLCNSLPVSHLRLYFHSSILICSFSILAVFPCLRPLLMLQLPSLCNLVCIIDPSVQ